MLRQLYDINSSDMQLFHVLIWNFILDSEQI